jgi:hypothetical protein
MNNSPMISLPMQAINNFSIHNSQILVNSNYKPKHIDLNQEIFYDGQSKSGKSCDPMPTFNPAGMQSAESFGNMSFNKGSMTLNELLMKKVYENSNTPTPTPSQFLIDRRFNNSFAGATNGSNKNQESNQHG